MELEFPVLVTSTEPEFGISALQEKWRDWNLPLSIWSQCYTSESTSVRVGKVAAHSGRMEEIYENPQ